MLMGQISASMTAFIQEVTPHEVAHQWWGHVVGWTTFHDQWLSEGFADFSAGIFLLETERTRDKFLKYMERSRDLVLDKIAPIQSRFNEIHSDTGYLEQVLSDTPGHPVATACVRRRTGAARACPSPSRPAFR